MIITEIQYFFSKIIRFQAIFKDTVEFTCALEFKISSQHLQKNDLQKKRPKMQIKKSAVTIAHPSFSVYNLGGRNVSFQNGSGTQTIFRSRTGNL